MKALVCYGKDQLKLEKIATPSIETPDQVLVKVAAAGICGSDFALFSGNGPSWNRYPVIPGHEVSGVVVDKGSGVERFRLGDAVLVDNYLRCGECYYCKKGDYFHCQDHSEVGFTINGGFAEFCLVPQTNLFLVPEGLDAKDAVLGEPTATAIRACRKVTIGFAGTVVVLGCGPIGMLLVAVAKSMGAGKVILVGRGERLKHGQEIGADLVVDSSDAHWPQRVLQANQMVRVDAVLEATGSAEIIDSSVRIVKSGGTVVLLGFTWGKPVTFSVDRLIMEEVRLITSIGGVGCFEEALAALAQRKVNPAKIITHTFPLDEFLEALRYDKERTEGAIKVRIVP